MKFKNVKPDMKVILKDNWEVLSPYSVRLKTITKSDVISQGATHKIIPAFISPNYTGFIEDASGIIVLVKYNTPETGNIVVYYKFSKQIPRTEKVILNLSKLNITIENKR